MIHHMRRQMAICVGDNHDESLLSPNIVLTNPDFVQCHVLLSQKMYQKTHFIAIENTLFGTKRVCIKAFGVHNMLP